MSDHRIEAKAVHKTFNDTANKLEVLRGIDLSVRINEFLAIQGPSGAGKSTLLHILGGLDNPSKGKVLFDGTDLYGLSDDERADFRNTKVGFAFQFYHLLPELNVLENVLLPALIRSWWKKKKAVDYAKFILEYAGLSKRLGHKPNQLSGGEQQRVAIARALINNPAVLLCDEPTGNLDSENGEKIIGLLRDLHKKEKMTIVLVTHDKAIAMNADRVVHLKDGVLVN